MAACLLAVACRGQAQAEPAGSAPAPEFVGIDRWINSPPLTLAGLRGKVVLVEFWTYACINCIHVTPHVNEWHRRYRDRGLVVVGVHTPEYEEERRPANVQAAVKRYAIEYPVALDNDYRTWNAYRNRFWPALYLIDRQGRVVYRHIGEGGYEATDARIRELLARD
ncbi:MULTISPECIES: thioredoxin family protein [Lysobacter]|uniref:Thioredoxin family protein n=1 Tax=Lysobacter firmicutimachus TaxID=1792846 RepID=A0ABU8D084_9GAMM|nr:thioredoxin family protein [Lysobacter antibioticus]